MVEDLKVFEDGLEESNSATAQPISWVLPIVGMSVGLIMGVVLLSSTSGWGAAAVSTSTSLSGLAPSAPRPVGSAGLVPGFPDAVVAIAGTDAASDEETGARQILLPVDQDEVVTQLLVDTPVSAAVDVTGSKLAVAVANKADGFLRLVVGTPASMEEVSSGVTGFVWHDSRPGYLAYTTLASGDWQLQVIEGSPVPRNVVSSPTEDGVVVAWGDWGWAIQSFTGLPTVRFLDQSGAFVSARGGIAYGSDPSGRVVVVDEDQLLVTTPGGGGSEPARSVTPLGAIAAASFSPDGKRLAIIGFNGLRVLPADGAGEVVDYKPLVGVPQVVWTSDSRFILVPGPSGISVIDTQTNTYQAIFPGDRVLALEVIPGGAG